eukprot:6195084-Pleurochrysis_carterae.AAC.1
MSAKVIINGNAMATVLEKQGEAAHTVWARPRACAVQKGEEETIIGATICLYEEILILLTGYRCSGSCCNFFISLLRVDADTLRRRETAVAVDVARNDGYIEISHCYYKIVKNHMRHRAPLQTASRRHLRRSHHSARDTFARAYD